MASHRRTGRVAFTAGHIVQRIRNAATDFARGCRSAYRLDDLDRQAEEWIIDLRDRA